MSFSIQKMVKNQYVHLLEQHIKRKPFKYIGYNDLVDYQRSIGPGLDRFLRNIPFSSLFLIPIIGIYKSNKWFHIVFAVLAVILCFSSSAISALMSLIVLYLVLVVCYGWFVKIRQWFVRWMSRKDEILDFINVIPVALNNTLDVFNVNPQLIINYKIESCGPEYPGWFNIYFHTKPGMGYPITEEYLQGIYYLEIRYYQYENDIVSFQINTCGNAWQASNSTGLNTSNQANSQPIAEEQPAPTNSSSSPSIDRGVLLAEAKAELNQMIGLQPVKEYLSEMQDMVSLRMEREKIGQDLSFGSMHMLFTGNPGTGKTTVARVAAKMLCGLGVVTKGHLVEVTREDLVAEYIGQTAPKTRKVIDKAVGGVLFIDEAYALGKGVENDFGQEAIDTLVKGIEENRSNLIVILAGYTKEMNDFLKKNSGLRSRFPNIVEFPDYKPEELLQIGKNSLDDQRFVIDEQTERALLQILERRQIAGRNDDGNGRLVRNIIEEAIRRQSKRLKQSGSFSSNELQILQPEDFGVIPSEETFDLETEFAKIVGNEEIKEHVRTLTAQLRIQKLRREQGLGVGTGQSLHMVFKGSPGTGKTTFARVIGKVLREVGVLKSGQIIEIDRSGLVASYIGQTAPKVYEVVKEALGGILFIDEAYALASGTEGDFGKEAIDALVKAMEDHRENLVIILAGYEEDMEKFFAVNPGLHSRFPTVFSFRNYTPEELYAIMAKFVEKERYVMDEGCEAVIMEHCLREYHSTQPSNGRFVRNLFEQAVRKQSLRLQNETQLDRQALMQLKPEDFTSS